MCLFCSLGNNHQDFLYENDLVYAIYDQFPVSKGHVLLIPKRHVEHFFLATEEEQKAILDAITYCKNVLDTLYYPDGYNIGVNQGVSAGQTIMHYHVHFIPRYKGDTPNPRGGVRGVIPNKQGY
jgi:diadenosine tetraphosphate (Ap4A) HIT family hydrolase